MPTSASQSPSSGNRWLEENFATYDRLQKEIHSYAELGYLEKKSSAALAAHLEENGFKIEKGAAGIPTAFIATFGQGHPVIGLLGEYDALKGLSQDTVPYKKPIVEGGNGHGCGHNLIGTGSAAAAVTISKWLAEGHEGCVKFFGCPAEEGGGGKYYMTQAGCFDGCDAIFHWHPGPANCVPLSTGLANFRINFNFHGISSHAAATPWLGRSALDAVEAFDYMMNMMREHVTPDMRIHYIISNGGKQPNVVPDEAQVIYYIRGQKMSNVKSVFDRAVKAAEGAALGTGTTMDYEIINASYECLVNKRIAKLLQKSLLEVGGPQLDDEEAAFAKAVQRASGAPEDLTSYSFIPSDVDPPREGGGSSDVGAVSQMAPLAGLFITTLPSGAAGLHSWQMTAVDGTSIGTKSVMTVARVFYMSALELYTNPCEVAAIREEFEAIRGKNPVFTPLMDRLPPLDYCL